ncbi:MAG: hypothetical protein ABEI86_14780, partial [Halobacteriaceae archaeon]
RLLGQPFAEPRRRLFITTSSASIENSGISQMTDHHTRRITYQSHTRSATTASVDQQQIPESIVTKEDGLDGLLDTILTEIDVFREQTEDKLTPAELRICFESFDTFLSEYSLDEVFRFLHLLQEVVRREQAMCHIHLPVPYGDERVQTVIPVFDGVIEMREGPQHRWHLQDPELTTDWISL